MVRVLMIFLLVVHGAVAVAATIQVERDGSGDYLIIQDAVDVAASGDTILIGPGRYDEGKVVTTPGWIEVVRVLVRQAELTLIGSGKNETIIGPNTPWDYSIGSDKGIVAGPWWGNQLLVVEGIGIENVGQGMRSFPMPELHVRNCRFEGNYHSGYWGDGSNAYIDNCDFVGIPVNGYMVLSYNNHNFNLTNCTFELPIGQPMMGGLDLQISDQVTVSDCRFSGGGTAIYNAGSSNVDISNCVISDLRKYGAYISGTTGFRMTDCTVSNVGFAWLVTGQNTSAEIRRVVVSGVEVASLGFDSFSSLAVHESILARGTEGAVWGFSPACDKVGLAADLTNNDWGTTNADSIQSWINTCEVPVEYIPYIGMPVDVEDESWGSVKAMFR